MSTSSAGLTSEQVKQVKFNDRHTHHLAGFLRWVIGWHTTAYLLRLPYAGWYLSSRYLSSQTTTFIGPHRSKDLLRRQLNLLDRKTEYSRKQDFFWDSPTSNRLPKSNYDHGLKQGWRAKAIARQNFRRSRSS